jgi:predicted transposase YbfD/YdcC
LPKKTLNTIRQQGGNYLIRLRGNQKALCKSVKSHLRSAMPLSRHSDVCRQKGRDEHRLCSVYPPPNDASDLWTDFKRLVVVERTRRFKTRVETETACFVSSAKLSAKAFGASVRQHWGIENILHRTKDVLFGEDHHRIRTGNAPQNWSLLLSLSLNLLSKNGFTSFKKATRALSNRIDKLVLLFRSA